MKKVFMTAAIVSMMIAAAACGNNAAKKAAEVEAAAEEAVENCCEGADSTKCAADSCANCDTPVEEVAE